MTTYPCTNVVECNPMLKALPARLKRDVVLSWFDSPQQVAQLHRQRVNEARLEALVVEDFD